jgi:hypothetical protein
MASSIPFATHYGCRWCYEAAFFGMAAGMRNKIAELYEEPDELCTIAHLTDSYVYSRMSSALGTWWNTSPQAYPPGYFEKHPADWGPDTLRLGSRGRFHMICRFEFLGLVLAVAPIAWQETINFWPTVPPGCADRISQEFYLSIMSQGAVAWWNAAFVDLPPNFNTGHTDPLLQQPQHPT